MTLPPTTVGPILFARGADDESVSMDAIVVMPDTEAAPGLLPDGGDMVRPEGIWRASGHMVWRYRFTLPAGGEVGYSLGDARYPVATRCAGDLRVAYVSCNGKEEGDAERPLEERDAMWRRLAEENDRDPFHLLLQGGDQVYADEVQRAHPSLARWAELPDDKRGSIAWDDEIAEAAALYQFATYLRLYGQPDIARVLARVPSLMIWDDHDIVDGWGSLPEPVLDSPVGRGLFHNARTHYLLFQLGCHPDRLPEICLDRSGHSLTTAARYPGLSIVIPDLRSERRPTHVMETKGWDAYATGLREVGPEHERLFVMSSVPALGPRLSWVERLVPYVPGARKYEDDLRDQWQSRAHREEWKRFLRTLLSEAEKRDVTVLSGEIHLATRGEMNAKGRTIHQLVSSGIAHPVPPAAYPWALGQLARFGEDPLPESPIRLHPLPGRTGIYTAQRNYLVLERLAGRWSAIWDLEHSGRTKAMAI